MGSMEQNQKVKKIKIDAISTKLPEFHFTTTLKDTDLFGIALEPAKPGDKARIARKGFYSEYEGDFFFTCLHEISALILGQWLMKKKFNESVISNCLIFIDRTRKADVFINCPTFMEVTVKEPPQKRNVIMREDISDIHNISFSGVHLRPECGVIYIFSVGWRRGIYFDFLPINPKEPSESGNLNLIFGACHAYLTFPEIYRYEEFPELKRKIYHAGWFPFIRILGYPFNEIYHALKNDLPISNFETKLIASFNDQSIREMCNTWITNQLFKKRESFLKKGIDEYIEKDYISAIHVLYPCIEGVLQDLSYDVDLKGDSGEKLTTKLILYLKSKNPETRLLLPDNFKEYLINSYFTKFDRKAEEIDLSRHSLAHGAATDEGDFTQVKALQTILILDQLSFYMQT